MLKFQSSASNQHLPLFEMWKGASRDDQKQTAKTKKQSRISGDTFSFQAIPAAGWQT